MRATASSGLTSNIDRIGQAEQFGQMLQEMRALLAAHQREMVLVAVEPGANKKPHTAKGCVRFL